MSEKEPLKKTPAKDAKDSKDKKTDKPKGKEGEEDQEEIKEEEEEPTCMDNVAEGIKFVVKVSYF